MLPKFKVKKGTVEVCWYHSIKELMIVPEPGDTSGFDITTYYNISGDTIVSFYEELMKLPDTVNAYDIHKLIIKHGGAL